MDFLNLPVDLLLKILSFLNLTDIFVFSRANRRCQQLARADMRFNFNKYFINIGSNNNWQEIDEYPNFLMIRGNAISNYLRIFGPRIKKLNVNFNDYSEEEVYDIFAYIGRYCWNLEEFSILNLETCPGRSLKRSFKSVKRLVFDDCKISAKMSNVQKWFPSLISLEINHETYFKNPSAMEVRFKNLILADFTTSWLCRKTFDMDEFVRLNPQTAVFDYYTYRQEDI